ncbi:MAG: hypothetical protein M1575_02830 [Patescibacteria group bacterium]|nr:hypothetical protein [Patescibacteria group bacterium]MCL5095639.1 hypothetical protein [Patescibacteria group bacterium]
MVEIKKTYHHVSIYLFNRILYVVGSVELPPIFVWAHVNPVIKLQDFSIEKLSQAIDSAHIVSKSHFDPDHANLEIKPWDGEKNRVWNHALKLWSLWWKEDGSVDMDTENPDKMYRGDMQWKTISEKTFSPPVSTKDIAREILKQL